MNESFARIASTRPVPIQHLHQPELDITTRAPVRTPAHQEIIEQLLQPQAQIEPKYFYDTLGCRLFELITGLPEYYPTRVEQSIMQRYANQIGETIGKEGSLIYLGAGNSAKAQTLFPILQPRQYLAIDLATDFSAQALHSLRSKFPQIEMRAIGIDLSHGIVLPTTLSAEPRVFFYPGSSIGNFEHDEALNLLTRIRKLCTDKGGLLIGVDLVKPQPVLEAAYSDALGVTAAFNRNVLNHINHLIGSDFDLDDWEHHAFFNVDASRIEMHLRAARECTASWHNGERNFMQGECIHTENSYKYTPDSFTQLLTDAGFSDICMWSDPKQWFGVFYARL
jgi:dimethylhistidine N-methyltransferase